MLSDLVTRAEKISSKNDLNLPSVALMLAEEIDISQKKLDALKVLLRDLGRDLRTPDSNRIVIPALLEGDSIGDVTVTFQRDRISLLGDPASLKESLGEIFFLFFEEKVSYSPKKDFFSLLENLPEEKKSILLENISSSEETPRVGFVYPR